MPDVYSVELTRSAERELNALHNPALKRVVAGLRDLSSTPRPRGCKKLVGRRASFRLRVGDYRVVYQVDDDRRLVTVYKIRHRSEVYD